MAKVLYSGAILLYGITIQSSEKPIKTYLFELVFHAKIKEGPVLQWRFLPVPKNVKDVDAIGMSLLLKIIVVLLTLHIRYKTVNWLWLNVIQTITKTNKQNYTRMSRYICARIFYIF